MNEYDKYTFEELAGLENGKVLETGIYKGVDYLIVKGENSVLAYIGFPMGHVLSGFDYYKKPCFYIDVHGGLTYAGQGEGGFRPETHWWYGWDYGHSGDALFFRHEEWYKKLRGKLDELLSPLMLPQTEWTLPMVRQEVFEAIEKDVFPILQLSDALGKWTIPFLSWWRALLYGFEKLYWRLSRKWRKLISSVVKTKK